ncbi:MAG: WcbI family polysaccharide biosynthesis putative acetyltransferase [Syntrophobacteraceae bacterium]|jgi:hypothetical protein
MKNCVIIANCQQGPLKFLLRSLDQFNRSYKLIDIAHVHTWSAQDVNSFTGIYESADLILSQPIFDNYFGLAKTQLLLEYNNKARKIPIIMFPNIDFIGFFPFSIRIPIRPERVFSPEAQCGIIFWSFINGYDEIRASEFCAEFYNDDSHSELYRTIYSLALQRLETTEMMFRMDANVSYLFRNKYMDEKLMHNRWHPSNTVYTFIASRILGALGVYENVTAPKREFTIQDEMPIAGAVKKALGIKFDDDDCFYNLGVLQSMPEYISTVYSFYGQNMPTVEATAKMSEKKLKIIDKVIKRNYDRNEIMPLFHW